jgi:outer membrane murein-binding lipoprotein Lpp
MAVATCYVAGCASAPKTDPVAFTKQALAATDSAKTNILEKGSIAEQNAIEKFEAFNSDYSAANITNNLKNVYAADVYFRDPFKEIHGEPELEAYLLRTSKAVAEFSMDWQDVVEHDGNYYFRWVMSVKLKRDEKSKPPSLTTGISFVRFGADGKVIFHQDYFDAAAFLYENIPVLGAEIRFIKKRL